MKRFYILTIALCAAIIYAAVSSSATPFAGIYKETGGDRMVVTSGASLDVESGGEADFESGSSLKLSGTTVTATASELNSLDADSQGSDGLLAQKVARATLDCSSSDCSPGSVGLGVNLPASAVLYRSFFRVSEQFADSGSGTVALECEDSGNIFNAADITGTSVGAFTDGEQDGAAANITGSIASSCEITAVIATAEQTSGVLNLWVQYMEHD